MKLIALYPIQHDNVFYDVDKVLEAEDSKAAPLIASGVARPVDDAFPVSKGEKVVRKPVKEEDKIVPTAEQIAEAEKAAKEPELTPEEQFEKGAIANSTVAQGDVKKIKQAEDHPRRK